MLTPTIRHHYLTRQSPKHVPRSSTKIPASPVKENVAKLAAKGWTTAEYACHRPAHTCARDVAGLHAPGLGHEAREGYGFLGGQSFVRKRKTRLLHLVIVSMDLSYGPETANGAASLLCGSSLATSASGPVTPCNPAAVRTSALKRLFGFYFQGEN